MKFLKIALLLATFVFTTGFLPFAAILGPGLTVASTGNVAKAGAQFLIDRHVKNKTGKNSFAYVKEEVTKQNNKNSFDKEFKNLVEKRVKKVHKKLVRQNQQNQQNKLNNDLKNLVEKRIKIVSKQLNNLKVNQ